MGNVERIVGLLRTDPQANVTSLIEDDASAMMERIMTSANPATQRRLVIEYATQVYTAAAEMMRREHSLRVTAALDAADANTRYEDLRNRGAATVAQFRSERPELTPDGETWDELSDERKAAISDNPVHELRYVLGLESVKQEVDR